ncbi:Uncharacterised protein r2_g4217 [Pycnogonum litorale]
MLFTDNPIKCTSDMKWIPEHYRKVNRKRYLNLRGDCAKMLHFIKSVLNILIVTQNNHKKFPKKPWIIQGILKSINVKNFLYLLYRHNPTDKSLELRYKT